MRLGLGLDGPIRWNDSPAYKVACWAFGQKTNLSDLHWWYYCMQWLTSLNCWCMSLGEMSLSQKNVLTLTLMFGIFQLRSVTFYCFRNLQRLKLIVCACHLMDDGGVWSSHGISDAITSNKISTRGLAGHVTLQASNTRVTVLNSTSQLAISSGA